MDFKLPFSATDPGRVQAAGLAPLLARDMALMFGQLGVASVRASVVDMDSMAFQSAWSVTEKGEVGEDFLGKGLDSTFPAAMATIAQMGVAPPEQTVVRKLNPRHWAFAWRIDERLVAVAEARYRDQRDMMSPTDTALVRLICDTGIRARQTERDSPRPRPLPASAARDHPHLQWPEVDRRQAPQVALSTRLGVLLMALSALLALWLTVWVAPRAREEALALQTEVQRLQALGSKSMVSTLAASLATGDYGELQAALANFGSLGHFETAVITNARQRVVAVVGSVPDVRIGDGVPPALARSNEALELTLGNERYGQLLMAGATVPKKVTGGARMVSIISALIGAAALCGVLLLVLRRGLRGTAPA